jgi:hypothetical protein
MTAEAAAKRDAKGSTSHIVFPIGTRRNPDGTVSRNNLNHEVRGSLIAHILLFTLMFDILVGSTSVGIVNNIRDWRHHNTFGLGLDEENYIMNLAPEPNCYRLLPVS